MRLGVSGKKRVAVKPFEISSSGDQQNAPDEHPERYTDRHNQQYTYTYKHTYT